jgi:hypothetical protein
LRPSGCRSAGCCRRPNPFAAGPARTPRGEPVLPDRERHQYTDAPNAFALLRARRERPRGCRATEQRDELAPFHSITSSAIADTPAGTSRPSANPMLLRNAGYHAGGHARVCDPAVSG